jgi:hypothetical protein
MIKFKGEVFFTIATDIEMIRSGANMIDKCASGEIPQSIIERQPKMLRSIKKHCELANLAFSAIHIERILESFEGKHGKYDCARLSNDLNELFMRFVDELKSVLLLRIPKDKVDYYEKAEFFGLKVASAFPLANFDIEEAGKCFATARYTACVMHLQRVLEVGLKSYGTFLGIASLAASAQPSWNKVLDETRKEIKERTDKQNTTKVWALKGEKEFCENIQPFLESVRTAWRNPSMHADAKYTEEIAEDIFSAVKRFMKHLAEHLDESGNFTP